MMEPEPELEPEPARESQRGKDTERDHRPTLELEPEPELEPEQVCEGVPPPRASPPPVGESIAVRARTAGQSDRVAALEEALHRQNEAGERREQVLKKQHHVALLGQQAHHSAELARRDDQIAQLQKIVQTLQEQVKRQDAAILRLRRQVVAAAAPDRDRDRDGDGNGDGDGDRALPPVDQTVVEAPGIVPGAVASADRRWCARRILLTITVCLVVPCAFSIAVPGGAHTLLTAVAILTLRELLVELGDGIAAGCAGWSAAMPVLCVLMAACGLGALRWFRNKAHNTSCCASRAKRE